MNVRPNPSMRQVDIKITDATPANVEPYGALVAAQGEVFAQWPGASVHGPIPLDIGDAGQELLFARIDARPFPVQVGLIERHFHHTQAFLPANGKPFVMAMGVATQDGAPVLDDLVAFRFAPASGIVLHKAVWHAFPYAIEDDTRFVVLLTKTAHINTLPQPLHPFEAEGPDLERRSLSDRATVRASF